MKYPVIVGNTANFKFGSTTITIVGDQKDVWFFTAGLIEALDIKRSSFEEGDIAYYDDIFDDFIAVLFDDIDNYQECVSYSVLKGYLNLYPSPTTKVFYSWLAATVDPWIASQPHLLGREMNY